MLLDISLFLLSFCAVKAELCLPYSKCLHQPLPHCKHAENTYCVNECYFSPPQEDTLVKNFLHIPLFAGVVAVRSAAKYLKRKMDIVEFCKVPQVTLLALMF